jgi:iron complex outermembrane receptor protein
VRSITAYEESHRDTLDDGDDLPYGVDSTAAHFIDDGWQASQELIMEGEGENYTWATGAYVMYDHLISQNATDSLRELATNQIYDQTGISWNVASEGHYDFLEEGEIPGLYQLSAEFSTRYDWQKKIFKLGAEITRADLTRSSLPPQLERKTWKSISGHFALQWKPVESTTIYTKYTRGQKSGHFNAGLSSESGRNTQQTIKPVKSEHIHAAEMGMNTAAFDGALKMNAAIFRYWYTDLQVFDIVNEPGSVPTQQLLNADADVMGFEIEGQYTPHWWLLEGLNLEGGFGWLDSEFTNFIVEKHISRGSRSGKPAITRDFDYSGNPLIASPEWNWSGVVEWEFPIADLGFITPRWDFSYKSKVYLDPQREEAISQDPYWIHHLRLGYSTPGGQFEVAAWVQNVFKEEYMIDVFDLTKQFTTIYQVWGEPRTYGITLSLSWP